MLPPIPHSLVPVTASQDVVKPKPLTLPVVPVAESSKESALNLDKRHPQDALAILREEQRRQQKRYAAALLAEADEESGPPETPDEDFPRQGLWVDIEV
ncbi:aspartate-semialdehyde dehydrogenase [Pseudomonas sp. M30-35]|uniref:aspartate-semialdehyde dehydrogenase n=1 Tax=Pseudomonas sp. M30-35 TaxID=1981174 RepID=UPI000B3CF968|nr:aspartate-semialdehyde dehydrogenase [Pseudomonas sp. M30-35]ARU89305.1 aspartate-semialdehyde dehydrogenase [Pseudomonas sp. M30-35]